MAGTAWKGVFTEKKESRPHPSPNVHTLDWSLGLVQEACPGRTHVTELPSLKIFGGTIGFHQVIWGSLFNAVCPGRPAIMVTRIEGPSVYNRSHDPFDGDRTSSSRQREVQEKDEKSSFEFFVYHRCPLKLRAFESPPNFISALLDFFTTSMRNAKTNNLNEWEPPDRNPNQRSFGLTLSCSLAEQQGTTMRCT